MAEQSILPSTPEDHLAFYKEQVADMFRWAGVGTWSYDLCSRSFTIPVEFPFHFGYDPEVFLPFTDSKWMSIIHPDDIGSVLEEFGLLVAGTVNIWKQDYRMRDVNGEYFWFHSVGGVAAYDLDGNALRITGTLQNITEHKRAEEQLKRRDALLEAVAKCATVLVNTTSENIDVTLQQTLQTLAEATGADRCYIWKNHIKDDRLKCTQILEWSPGAAPVQDTYLTQTIDFADDIPTWKVKLTNGECINSIVKHLSEAERRTLDPQHIISILVAPIIFRGNFWGFIGFDDCHNERTWSETERQILTSAGMLIATTINRIDIEKDLNEDRLLLDQIFETSPVVTVLCKNRIVKRCNREAIRLFGDQTGQPNNVFYNEPETVQTVLEAIKKNGIFYEGNYPLIDKDGNVRNFIAAVFAIDLQKETLISWFVDITELRMTEVQLIQARDAAEEATKAKSEFLARMSHEIRTPMNAILGIVYLCLQTELTVKQRDYLQKTQTAASNLLGIINDILDFSKVEAGKLELENVSFNLSDVLNEIKDVTEGSAQEKGLQLTFNNSADNLLIGDPLRLRQILLNLVSNAVKFTEEGEITVTVKPVEDACSAGEAVIDFSVTDTGIGLTEWQISGIFDSFAQADSSTTRKYGGTGLGLSIVKRLVELMHGHIDVISILGKGTTFHFTAEFGTADKDRAMNSTVLLNRRRVLVVDDEYSSREVVVELAKTLNLQAEGAATGTEALEKLVFATRINQPYELVLMDWRMPRMDGIETIREIHKREHLITPMSIVMISAYDRQDCLRLTQGLNVAGVLTKPVKVQDLKNVLKTAFRLIQINKKQERKADIKGAKVLLAEDNKVNQLVASELLKMYGVTLMIVNNGLEAVEAVQKNDFDLILMDVQMPEMDGLEAVRRIRQLAKPNIKRLPILAMTANAMDVDYKKSLDAGMNDHLTKPIDPNKLRLALEKWIEGSSSETML